MNPSSCLKSKTIEWPTLVVCVLCYAGFGLSTYFSDQLGWAVSGVMLTLALTLFSSFNHEVLHGHPFKNTTLNTALVFPALGIFIPYFRFRDTHLQHHFDPSLTDPYDDPETNYIDPVVWASWPFWRKALYKYNNTLLGRMLLGPALSLMTFYASDARSIWGGNRRVLGAYVFHAVGLIPVVIWLVYSSTMPLWLFGVAVYSSLSLLKIRTFLEHRAHEKSRCRSVIIEDRGLLSFLFLKNNLHAVHHASPGVPWYNLQAYYVAQRRAFLRRNEGYAYRSYAEIFTLYFLRAKDPVPHSLSETPEPRPERPQTGGIETLPS